MRRAPGILSSVWIAALLCGCYSPAPPEGEACSETNRCPDPQRCDLTTLTCVDVVPEAARFVSFDAGQTHACGIDGDGVMWCWGDGDAGALGSSNSDNQLEPVRVVGDPGWAQVSASRSATCAIRIDGSLWGWGDPSVTGLGGPRTEPALIDVGPWQQVVAGVDGFCVLGVPPSPGDAAPLWCAWDGPDSVLTEVDLGGLRPVTVAASRGRVCIIDDTKHLACWGTNDEGQVDGTASADVPLPPVEPMQGTTWNAVAAGTDHTCAIDASNGVAGGLWCWGRCDLGQTGPGTDTSPCAPHRVGSDTYVSVSLEDTHTCAVRTDRVIQCFGANHRGQAGDHGDEYRDELVQVSVFTDFGTVSAGSGFTCGARGDFGHGGETYCWGDNELGQLGDGRGGTAPTPVEVEGAGGWTMVSPGTYSTCGIQADGSLWCWGMNPRGQLGDGSLAQRDRPRHIGTDTDWIAVSAGAHHTCGLRAGGTAWCWGSNVDEALGQSTTADVVVPTQVGVDAGWTAIAAGEFETCGVKDGTAMCWGDHFDRLPAPVVEDSLGWGPTIAVGNLGNGPALGSWAGSHNACGIQDGVLRCWTSDFEVDDESTLAWQSFTVGWSHGCGIVGADEAWCIGTDTAGELGQNMIGFDPLVPVQIGGTWKSISAGDGATCGIAGDDGLFCWGEGPMVGASFDTNVPIPYRTAPGSWASVAVGVDHVCAIRDDATLWCWGLSEFGQLGTGMGGSDRPRRVTAPELP